MKKVLVTGCNGFIGRQFIKYLFKKDILVIGCDINECECEELKGKIIYKNISELDNVQISGDYNLFSDIDVLYHLAWSGVSSSDKNNYIKQFANFNITYKILLFCAFMKVKKLIVPGSSSQFSKCRTAIKGCEQFSPSDLYASTKCALQVICTQFCELNNIDLNWLLITSIYGSSRNDDNLITYTINSLKSDKRVKTTKLEQEWDYLYIDDLIFALFLIGEKGQKNVVYPIGSGNHHPLKYYVETIAQIMEREYLIDVGALPYKNNFIDNSIVDLTELYNIGFKINNDFKVNIKSIINNSSNN